MESSRLSPKILLVRLLLQSFQFLENTPPFFFHDLEEGGGGILVFHQVNFHLTQNHQNNPAPSFSMVLEEGGGYFQGIGMIGFPWIFEKSHAVFNFKLIYLEAQTELEDVFRVEPCLFDAIGTLELIWSEHIPSL